MNLTRFLVFFFAINHSHNSAHRRSLNLQQSTYSRKHLTSKHIFSAMASNRLIMRSTAFYDPEGHYEPNTTRLTITFLTTQSKFLGLLPSTSTSSFPRLETITLKSQDFPLECRCSHLKVAGGPTSCSDPQCYQWHEGFSEKDTMGWKCLHGKCGHKANKEECSAWKCENKGVCRGHDVQNERCFSKKGIKLTEHQGWY